MEKYICTVCGYIYDEAQGIPDESIAPGTQVGGPPGRLGLPPLRSNQRGI